MKEKDVILKEKDYRSIGDTIVYLSDSIDKVADNINSINGQVDNFQEEISTMKNNVDSLEAEIREFMTEMKQSNLVGNAKQSIMISQMEYEKKYGHRDDVRRRVIGLLQAVDINAIKKNTMETIGEETIVNNPDYWLAPALVALCYWFTDNKEMAKSALKKAIDRSDEKTSFLFCLIHLRANRIDTAVKWLNRYLSLQDPTKMDCKIILLLDALSNGVFNEEIKNILIQKLKQWNQQLNIYPEFKENQINRWKEYFKKKDTPSETKENYLVDYVVEAPHVQDVLHYSKFHINMYNEFKTIMTKKDSNNHYSKIDKLLHMLIFDYDEEELKLKSEIKKNTKIINFKGNLEEINKYNDNTFLLYNETDLRSHITNIALNNDIFDVATNTQKMAIALSKNYIIPAYKAISKTNENDELIDLTIAIDDWVGLTKDGSNESALKSDLEKHIENKYYSIIYTNDYFSKDTIISIIIAIVVIALTYKYSFMIILTIITLLIYNGLVLYNNYQKKQNKKKEMEQEKKEKQELLLNTIVDIVNYNFTYIESKGSYNEFIKYINSLEYSDYIKTSKDKHKRNIIIGGK